MTSIARQAVGVAFHGSTASLAWAKPTQAGSFLLCEIASNGGTDIDLLMTSAGWTHYSTDVDRLTSVSIATYYKENAPSESAAVQAQVVLTGTNTATTRYGQMYLREYAGMAASSVIDTGDPAAGSSGSSTAPQSAGVATSGVANAVAVGIIAHANAPFSCDLGANSTGYTELLKVPSPSSGTDRLNSAVYEKQLGASGSTFQLANTITGGISRAWGVRTITLTPTSTTPVTPGVPCAQGLFRAGASTLDRMPPVMNGITYYPDWRNLEAANTGALNGTAVAAIDNLITYCNANGLQLKIRLFVNGNNAPGGLASCPPWLTTLCGTFKHANSQHPTTPEVMTRFWVQPFLDHYDRLQQLMSARWDSAPELVDVTISNAMMKYAEPLIRDLPVDPNRAELVGGGPGFSGATVPGVGYSDALNIAAIKAGMDTHAAYWPNTCSSFAFNPYQILTSYTAFDQNDDATLSHTLALINYMRQVLGPRGVLENNSVRDQFFTYNSSGAAIGVSTAAGAYKPMYEAMLAAGPPLFFQTATRNPNRIGDLSRTMDGIINVLGGNAVEPPPDYAADSTSGAADAGDFSVASFTAYNAALIANPTGAGTGTVVTKSDTDSIHFTDAGAVSVITAGVVTKTDSDSITFTDADALPGALGTVANPTGHKPGKRS